MKERYSHLDDMECEYMINFIVREIRNYCFFYSYSDERLENGLYSGWLLWFDNWQRLDANLSQISHSEEWYVVAGLFDSQLCSQSNISNVHQLTKEMYRVLKPGGMYLMISHGPPDNRLGYLQRSLAWKVEYKTIGK